MLRSEAVFPFPSQAQLDGRYVRLVGEQVTGINAFAPPTTIDAPRGTGYSVPSGFIFRVPKMRVGIGEDAVPQEYAEGFRVQEVANVSGREITLWNRTGTLMARIPANIYSGLLNASASFRIDQRMLALGADVTPDFVLFRMSGTYDSPSAVSTAITIGQFAAGGADSTTPTVATSARIAAITREAFSPTNKGTLWRVSATDVASASVKTLLDMQGGGTNIAELVSGQSTLRLIPGANGIAERNNLNTANARYLSADGTIFTLPLTTRMSLPSLPTSPAGLVAGEIWVDTGAGNVLKRV